MSETSSKASHPVTRMCISNEKNHSNINNQRVTSKQKLRQNSKEPLRLMEISRNFL
jgi:hypothetical protein